MTTRLDSRRTAGLFPLQRVAPGSDVWFVVMRKAAQKLLVATILKRLNWVRKSFSAMTMIFAIAIDVIAEIQDSRSVKNAVT